MDTHRNKRHAIYFTEPEFVKKLEPLLSAKEGDGVVFRCQYKGFPKPSVQWLKDNEVLNDGGSYRMEQDDSWLLLRLEKTNKWDEGTYRCKLENSEGSAITTCYLEVKGENFCMFLAFCKIIHQLKSNPFLGCTEVLKILLQIII